MELHYEGEQRYLLWLHDGDRDIEFQCPNPSCGHKNYFEITTPVFHDITGVKIPITDKEHTLTCMKCGTETRIHGEPQRLSNWEHLVKQTKMLCQYGFNTFKPDQDMLAAIEEVETMLKEQQEGLE